MNRLLVSLFILIFSTSSFSAGWSANVQINEVYQNSAANTNGTIYVFFTSMINPDNCGNSDMIALLKDNNVSSEIYSAMLMAFTTNKNVKYYVDGCDSLGYPKLKHFRIVN